MSQGFATTDTFPPITDVTASSPLSSSGGTTPNISHDNSGVTPGSYTNASVTVDATGHVTSASSGTAPVTSISVSSPITSTGGTTPTIGHATAGTAGTYGSATQVAQITTDATGHVSGVTQVTISGVAPGGSAGGDLSGTYPNPTVDGLQGTPVSASAPVHGQALLYDGTQWVPGTVSGGGGGGGVVLYLNENTAAQAPTTNIPVSTNGLVTVKQMGKTPDVPQTGVLSSSLSTTSYDLICNFVTDVGYPDVTTLPAGLFELNVWADASGNNANQSLFQARLFKYDGSTSPTLIASSDDIYMYDPNTIAQYIATITVPAGITLLATDRLVVGLYAKGTTSGRHVHFYFGDATPSHVHTTIIDPVNLSTGVTGTLPITNGGTGSTSLTAHGALVSNSSGTAVTTVAPGASGRVLTSDGTDWTSGAAPVLSVSASSPLSSSGGTTPTISLGTVGIGNGGTGVTSLTAYGALVSNSAGTAVATVAPGANGNVLTSDGTQWTSGPAPVTGLTQPQVMTRISFGGF